MNKKVLLPVIVVMFIYGMSVFLAWLRYPTVSKGHITAKNHEAKVVRDFIFSSLKANILDLPSEEVYFLSGEYGEHYFMIYANDWIPENRFIYGSESETEHAYWTVRIDAGEVQEAWLGDQPIPESALHEYTISDQQEHIYFVNPLIHPIKWWKSGWADDSEILGYYHNSDAH